MSASSEVKVKFVNACLLQQIGLRNIGVRSSPSQGCHRLIIWKLFRGQANGSHGRRKVGGGGKIGAHPQQGNVIPQIKGLHPLNVRSVQIIWIDPVPVKSGSNASSRGLIVAAISGMTVSDDAPTICQDPLVIQAMCSCQYVSI